MTPKLQYKAQPLFKSLVCNSMMQIRTLLPKNLYTSVATQSVEWTQKTAHNIASLIPRLSLAGRAWKRVWNIAESLHVNILL